tara:strand:- start:3391 stop:3759 length:369 start_codon:yes stop_codon:yes gene_type:complete
MLALIATVVSAVSGLGSEWMKKKGEVGAAKHEAKITRIKQDGDWEKTMSQGSVSSWKDEFWTLVIAAPLILVFFPATRPWIEDGFVAIQTVMPEWYVYVLSVAVASAFGVRSIIGSIKKLKA